jgi:hypothetical protein
LDTSYKLSGKKKPLIGLAKRLRKLTQEQKNYRALQNGLKTSKTLQADLAFPDAPTPPQLQVSPSSRQGQRIAKHP